MLSINAGPDQFLVLCFWETRPYLNNFAAPVVAWSPMYTPKCPTRHRVQIKRWPKITIILKYSAKVHFCLDCGLIKNCSAFKRQGPISKIGPRCIFGGLWSPTLNCLARHTQRVQIKRWLGGRDNYGIIWSAGKWSRGHLTSSWNHYPWSARSIL